MRAVKLEKHNAFADENDMYSYFVSAKTGDNVNAAFHRIAADWAGVVLTKPEMEVAAKPVVANIVNHARNMDVPAGEQGRGGGGDGGCSVM
jgi:Ras-related protein Rab-28